MTQAATHPFAEILRLKGLCEDCGRQTVWDRDRVAREQIKRRFRTPEELGSRFRCEFCVARGGDGRNIAISIVYVTPPPNAYADRRPLTEITDLVSVCGHCGDRQTFDRAKLDSVSGEAKTVEDLWRHAFCAKCQADGCLKPDITLYPEPPLAPQGKQPAPVKWSRADVFGENRSDPFPTLPRRRFAVETC